MQDEWSRLEIMTLTSESPNNSIEFFAIGAVIACGTIQLLTKVGNGPLGLEKDISNPHCT